MSSDETEKSVVEIDLSIHDLALLAHGQGYTVESDTYIVRIAPPETVDAEEAAHLAGRLFHDIGDKIETEQMARDE